MVVPPFELLLCTLWELCAHFLIYILLFTDKKKNKNDHLEKIFLLILQSFTSSYMNVVYCGILIALDWTFMD